MNIMTNVVVTFKEFKTELQSQFKNNMVDNKNLFKLDIDTDKLWDMYLNSFPEGSNDIYRERREHDCSCCRHFIKHYGSIVSIDNKYNIVSMWDNIDIGGCYKDVANKMSSFIKSHIISNGFFSTKKKVGTDFNYEKIDNKDVKKWEHFYLELPQFCLTNDIGAKGSYTKSKFDVFKRSMEELSLDSANTILDLINQNSIYRGQEHKETVVNFIKTKRKYNKIHNKKRINFCWKESVDTTFSAIRNTVIGSLLIDISGGKDIEQSVKSFENKVAPSNYKRPKAIVTKKMVEMAQEKVKSLGIEKSLIRRHAVDSDISVNDVVYIDRNVSRNLKDTDINIFEDIISDIPQNSKSFDKVEDVNIEKFIKDIVPTATSIEFMFEGKNKKNLVNLIAPNYPNSPNILQWDNNFSWSYNGDVTDSIKDKVKKAGGSVTGDLRTSLSWENSDDLDIHVIEPNGEIIKYSNKKSYATGGELDIDMNAGEIVLGAVENITWSDKNKLLEGEYQVYVHNYTKRSNKDVGFEVEIEFMGEIINFNYPQEVKSNHKVQVVTFTYNKKTGVKFKKSKLVTGMKTQNIWDIDTNQWHKVNMIMKSPNHWENSGKKGNLHYFFMLDKCENDGIIRGIYNEFLSNDLNEHRKVFEVLGSKTKVPYKKEQLAGLGFSSTNKESILCKVSGSFDRVIRVNF